MVEFNRFMIERIINEFPNCIECGWEDRVTYFHKDGCQREAGLPINTLIERMETRWNIVVENDVTNMHLTCANCDNEANGTGWIYYHNTRQVIDFFPLCLEHSIFSDNRGRRSGFIPNLVTTHVHVVQHRLDELGE